MTFANNTAIIPPPKKPIGTVTQPTPIYGHMVFRGVESFVMRYASPHESRDAFQHV
jgi:hypothetical protein